jgi:hypothetical protein
MREIDEIFIPLKKSHRGNIQQNIDDVVVLAISSSRSNPIQRRKWRRLREMHTWRYGGVVDGIDSMTVWCLWWRVFADRAPVCMVEEERRKEASETGQRLRANLVTRPSGLCPFYRSVQGFHENLMMRFYPGNAHA